MAVELNKTSQQPSLENKWSSQKKNKKLNLYLEEIEKQEQGVSLSGKERP